MIKNFNQFLTESESTFRIFCDMDGVLTNFNKGFEALNDEHLSPNDYEEKHGKNSVWPLIKQKGSKFWSELEWMPDGQVLWNYLQPLKATILSSPSREYSSIVGKTKWINEHLGISQTTPTTKSKDWDQDTRIILSQYKYLFVVPEPNVKSILIDDTPSKLDKWIAAGGIGILHKSASETIAALNRIIK